MKKIAFLFLSLLFFANVFADDDFSYEPPNTPNKQYIFALPLKGGSIAINGEFLWWKPYARIPYSLVTEPQQLGTVPTATSRNERMQKVNMEFHPGFRLMIGLYMPVPTWKVYWEYTRIRTSSRRETRVAPGERLTPIWQTVPIFATEPATQPTARAKQMLNYNIFDWSLLNYISFGKNFIMLPWFGLRTAYIRNDLTVDYEGVNTAPIVTPVRDEARLKNHFRAMGLRGGFWVNYVLTRNWMLYVNTYISLLVSRITNRVKQVFTMATTNSEVISGDVSNANRFLSGKSAFELALGIFWGTRWGKLDSRYIGFSAAYEVHHWPNQLQYMRFTPNTGINSFPNPVDFYKSDLTLQGLSLRAKLEF